MYFDLALFCAALCVVGLPLCLVRVRDYVERKRFERWLAKASDVGR